MVRSRKGRGSGANLAHDEMTWADLLVREHKTIARARKNYREKRIGIPEILETCKRAEADIYKYYES